MTERIKRSEVDALLRCPAVALARRLDLATLFQHEVRAIHEDRIAGEHVGDRLEGSAALDLEGLGHGELARARIDRREVLWVRRGGRLHLEEAALLDCQRLARHWPRDGDGLVDNDVILRPGCAHLPLPDEVDGALVG